LNKINENWDLIEKKYTTKNTHISCQFCFEFFLGHTYKFGYEKKFARTCCQFFAKYFV